MLNINTIDELEDIGVGCNIDKLEYVVAKLVCRVELGGKLRDKEKKLIELLKEIKPSSTALSIDTSDMDKPIECYDRLIDIDRDREYSTIRSIESTSYDKLKDSVGEKSDIGVCLIPYGIPVRLIYVHGEYKAAFVYFGGKAGRSITRKLLGKVPSEVRVWKDCELAEVRAHLMCNDTVEFVMNDKEDKSLTDSVKVLVSNVVTDNAQLRSVNIWHKLEYLEQIGFEGCAHLLYVDIDGDTLEDVIEAIKNMSDNSISEVVIETVQEAKKKDGFKLSVEDIYKERYVGIISDIQYELNGEYFRPVIKLNAIKAKHDKVISEVKLNNIRELSENNCTVGGKVIVEVQLSGDIILKKYN